MRVSKEMIRNKVELINNRNGYEITVFERAGLNSILTIKHYGRIIVDKVLPNKSIYDRLNSIEKELANEQSSDYRIIFKDYRTEETIGVTTMEGKFSQILDSCSKVPHKHIISNEFDRVIEIYY